MPECLNTVSELEFEQMTDTIDKRAFKRKMVGGKITKAAVILVLAALALHLITYIPNCVIAQRTYDDIMGAIYAGGVVIDGVFYDDPAAVARIGSVSISWNNKVVVSMSRVDEETIAEFKAAFPDAKRVVFRYDPNAGVHYATH